MIDVIDPSSYEYNILVVYLYQYFAKCFRRDMSGLNGCPHAPVLRPVSLWLT